MITKVTAHAGCEGTPAGSRENILAALQSGADAVEMDLRALDGRIYLSHDPLEKEHLERYLTFRQALELLRDSEIEINCDLKEIGILGIAQETLKTINMQERAFYTGEVGSCQKTEEIKCRCFQNIEHYGFVEDGRQLSEAEVHKLIRVFKTREPQLAGFNVEYGMLTQEAIDLFTKENVPLSCWIVDDERAICQLLRANITYITTNHVKYAIAQREKLL